MHGIWGRVVHGALAAPGPWLTWRFFGAGAFEGRETPPEFRIPLVWIPVEPGIGGLWTLPNGWPGTPQGVIMGNPERTSHEEARVAETLKKGSRVTGAARDKLAADLKKKYDSGASIRALAEETGRSYGFVHRMLSESGVTLRGRGGATRGKKAASA